MTQTAKHTPEATPQPQEAEADKSKAPTKYNGHRKLQSVLKKSAPDGKFPVPKGKTRLIKDVDEPNLWVRITDKGYASFWVVRPQRKALNKNGKRKLVWHRLGRCADLSLAEAHTQAQTVRKMLDDGKSPKEEEEKQRQKERLEEAAEREAEARKVKNSFAGALERFFASERFKKLRTQGQIEGTLRREFLGQIREDKKWLAGPEEVWSKTPIGDINRDKVELRLGEIKLRGGKWAARHARGALGSFYRWVTKKIEAKDLGIKLSPCDGIDDEAIGFDEDHKEELKRNRVLTDAELFDVWWAAKVVGYPFGPVVQLLMLSGQRRNEIAATTTKEDEIDLTDKLLTIPAERYKTGKEHKVPLQPLAVQIIEKLPKVEKATYIFSTTFGKRPISGFSKMKRKLDSLIAEWREVEGRKPMPAWTLHDIRRTVKTRMGDLGIDDFISERVLGHALSGLGKHYNQSTHLQQKREALDRWAARLAQIVGLTPPSDQVVTFAEEKKRRTKGRR